MKNNLSQKHKFYMWFIPLVLIFVGYTFYLMKSSHIPYKLGISHWFNPQKTVSINPADVYEEGSSYVILEMNPGEQTTARARVRNLTNEDVSMDMFSLDTTWRTAQDDPGFKLESRSAETNEVGAWITLPKDRLELPKHKEEIVEFTVTVPENAELDEYAGGVAIEEISDPSEAKEGEIQVKLRYALRVYIKVTDNPNQPMYYTWEQRMETTNKLFLIHSGIVLTNLIILIGLFIAYKPKKTNT